ncbi:STAS domain-containing protein [Paracoccus nototheniae]|uniref:STAS domain-containing protein n=1 Tax=Paracoccus nototheniae TaxID=2489002 RepID=UPI0013F478DF|nr:STAS domain-containing protein [Paracoccus nototheniae]
MHALPLPGTLDRKAASELARLLLECRGTDAALDAAEVGRVSAPALETLISARNQWRADGRTLTVINPSPAFLAGIEGLGASMRMLQTGGAT